MEIDELNHTPRETAWGSFLSYSIFQILIYRGVDLKFVRKLPQSPSVTAPSDEEVSVR